MKFADEVSLHDWLIGPAAIRTILDETAVQLSAFAPVAVIRVSAKFASREPESSHCP
jgi:hypothetical protein